MQLRKRHLPTILFVVTLLVINLYVLRNWFPVVGTNSPSLRIPSTLQASTILRYGAQMPRLTGKSLLTDKMIEVTPGRFNLILSLSPFQKQGYSIGLARAAELLWEQNGKERFTVTALVRGNIPDLRDLIEHSLINYDVISDTNGELAEKLGIREHENGTFLFDPDNLCRFSTDYAATSEDLKQLIAVEILNSYPIDKPPLEGNFLEQWRSLGSWSLTDVRAFEQTSLDAVRKDLPGLFVFFKADCSVCSLPGYLEQFAEFQRKRSHGTNQSTKAVLIFDFNFSRTDVIENLKKADIDVPAYIANQELSAISNLADKREANLAQVIAVQTDARHKNPRVSSLTALEADEPHSQLRPATQSVASVAVPSATYEEVFHGLSVSPFAAAMHDGKYYVSDVKGNRIIVLNRDQGIEKEIGRIGSGPGCFLHPKQLGIAADGTLYVYDAYNDRIQQFGPEGSYRSEFNTTLFRGFAVGPRNEIYLGQPEKGSLITAYSGSGKRLRSFGKLKKFSEVYGSKFSYKDDLYNLAINRVNLSTDSDGSIYASFMLVPLIQKYNSDGKLIFERRLEGPHFDKLTRVLLTDTEDIYVTTSIDGFQEKIIAIDPVIEPSTGRIYVVLIDGSIQVVAPDGEPLYLLRPKSKRGFFYPDTAGLGSNGEVLVISYNPKTCFRLVETNGATWKNISAGRRSSLR